MIPNALIVFSVYSLVKELSVDAQPCPASDKISFMDVQNRLQTEDTCAGYLQNPSIVYPHEKVCSLRSSGSNCDSCCGYSEVCCDDGSCVAFDQFCRFPSTCCAEAYCGQSCCNSTAGDNACGALCAPNGFVCCDQDRGQMCKSPDTCCGDHCCGASHFCCHDHCCETGYTCCNEVCCPPGHQCCGSGFCCPADTECQSTSNIFKSVNSDSKAKSSLFHKKTRHEIVAADASQANFHSADMENKNSKDGSSCCPDAQICGEHLCCQHGFHCVTSVGNACCDNEWCDGTCCHNGTYCNPAGGCCQNGDTFCPHGQNNNCFRPPYTHCCSNGDACPTGFRVCVGDGFCCPVDYPHFVESQGRCYNQQCKACGSDQCCASPYYCLGDYCKKCNGHWWNKQCECNVSPNHINAHHISHIKGVRAVKSSRRGGDVINEYKVQYKNVNKNVHPRRISRPGSRTGFIPPPAPDFTKKTPNSFPCFTGMDGNADPCDVLPCYEKMTGCGPEGYLDTTRSFFCNCITTYYGSFNEKAREFLSKLRVCMMDYIHQAYMNKVIPCCRSLQVWSKNFVEKDCFISSGFCDVYVQNSAVFGELFTKCGDVNPAIFYDSNCKF